MITVITGKRKEHIHAMCRELVNNRPYFDIYGADVEDLTSEMLQQNKVEVLIIDNVENVNQVDFLITSEMLFHGFKKPEIIIMSTALSKSDFNHYAKRKLLHHISSEINKPKKQICSYEYLIWYAGISSALNLIALAYYFLTRK